MLYIKHARNLFKQKRVTVKPAITTIVGVFWEMERQRVSMFFFAAAILIAALLMATAAYAAASTLPPCYNGIQDGNEKGVDCGGSCDSPSLIEFCDGKDNDMDCLVDEECKNWSSENSGSSDGLGASGKGGGGSGESQGPPLGYQKFTIPNVTQVSKSLEPDALKSVPASEGQRGEAQAATAPASTGDNAPVAPKQALGVGAALPLSVPVKEESSGASASNNDVNKEQKKPQAEQSQQKQKVSIASKIAGFFRKLFRW